MELMKTFYKAKGEGYLTLLLFSLEAYTACQWVTFIMSLMVSLRWANWKKSFTQKMYLCSKVRSYFDNNSKQPEVYQRFFLKIRQKYI